MTAYMVRRQARLRPGDRREATVQTVVDLARKQDSTDLTTEAVAKRLGVIQGRFDRPPQESWVRRECSSAMLTWASATSGVDINEGRPD